MSRIQWTVFLLIVINNYLALCYETVNVHEAVDRGKFKIKKCCPSGKLVSKFVKCKKIKSNVANTALNFADVKLYNENIEETGLILKDRYDIEEGAFNNSTFKTSVKYYLFGPSRYYLTGNNALFVEFPNKWDRWTKLNTNEFCLDYHAQNTTADTPTLRFYIADWVGKKPPQKAISDFRIGFITSGYLLSSLFLILVLVVYSVIPELRNIGGMVLMAYVSSLLGAFTLQAALRLKNNAEIPCLVMTLFVYFFWLASFCWTNVMSLDIWWTFRGIVKARAIHRRGVLFKFQVYCLYAWGVPLLMTIFLTVISLVNIESVSWLLSPGIVDNPKCFLGDAPQLVYLYGPMLFLSVTNWIFFFLTMYNMTRVEKGSKIIDNDAAGNPRKQKRRFLVYVRLSVVMGVNWALEVYSYFRPDDLLSYFADGYNVLLGVFIFIIFICKKSILLKFVKKYRTYKKPRRMSKMRFTSDTSESDCSNDGTTPVIVCAHPNGCDDKDKCKQHFNFS